MVCPTEEVLMPYFALLFFMFASPFWQEKMPADWTDVELSEFFVDSPWAQASTPTRTSAPGVPVQVYLATGDLVVAAEKEHAKRVKARRKPGTEKEDPLAEEYQVWLEDNRATQIVLAIRIAANPKLSEQGEVKHMEDDSFMQVGRGKKVKMTGHFPPTPQDPYLRLAFPREPLGDEKTVTFGLYVPGLPLPFREVQFKLKDLMVNGKPEL
jgi:hypothetical protein